MSFTAHFQIISSHMERFRGHVENILRFPANRVGATTCRRIRKHCSWLRYE